ncbi:hypothetical protein Q9233_005977 [Columba guinea]|nr:hypothetical protein Q9233_005977 [Columba guinea]
MAVETRPELVGKRFLCVGGEEPPESGRWRAGVIRAVSQRDSRSPDLAVYVEFDDLEWEKREWVKVYEDFATFLVEYQLVWAKRKDPSQTQGSKIKQIQWPALDVPLVLRHEVVSRCLKADTISNRIGLYSGTGEAESAKVKYGVR